MSLTLARLGRFAARRPWTVIGAWVVVAMVVLAASTAFGQDLEDPFEAPGLDSHDAAVLLERANAGEMGIGADVVVTPDSAATGALDTPALQADVARVEDTLAALPHTLGTSVTTEGEVALVRVQYPETQHLDPQDLANLKSALDDLRTSTQLQIEAGGDLYFAFETAPAGASEGIGLLVAIVVLLVAFGSLIAMGLPIGTALVGLAVASGLLPLVAYAVDIPEWASVIGAMVGLGVGIDYALFIVTRYREQLAEGHTRRGLGRWRAGHRRPVGGLRRRHRGRRHPRAGRRPDPVHHRRRDRHLDHRAGDGARLDHPAAGPARPRRPPRERPMGATHRAEQRSLAPLGCPRRPARHGVRRRVDAVAPRPRRAGLGADRSASPTRAPCRSRAPSDAPTT